MAWQDSPYRLSLINSYRFLLLTSAAVRCGHAPRRAPLLHLDRGHKTTDDPEPFPQAHEHDQVSWDKDGALEGHVRGGHRDTDQRTSSAEAALFHVFRKT